MAYAKLGLFAGLIFLFASACSAADSDAHDRIAALVGSAVRPVIQEHNIPGLAVAVTHNGVRYYFNYGVESRDSKQPVSQDTIFEIGSISKTFTATLASFAQVSGALSLSDNASKYFPALRGSSFDNITLLDLATYSAGGLPLQFPDEVNSQEKMVGFFRSWKPSFSPGTRRLYSNPSIGLFGHLAAESMGISFAELMERSVFTKLGLKNTYLKVPEERMKQYAQGYTKADTPIRVSAGPLDAEAYGVKTTAGDLIRFVEANMSGRESDNRLQQAIAATHTGYYKVGDMTQALGWEWYRWPIALDKLLAGNSSKMLYEANAADKLNPPLPAPDSALINKTGSTNGFGAYVAFVPGKGLGVVILANKNYPIPARVKAAFEILVAVEGQAGLEVAVDRH
ncbi:MAG: class C beta-lactamase [Betaproteobacteria bacterium]